LCVHGAWRFGRLSGVNDLALRFECLDTNQNAEPRRVEVLDALRFHGTTLLQGMQLESSGLATDLEWPRALRNAPVQRHVAVQKLALAQAYCAVETVVESGGQIGRGIGRTAIADWLAGGSKANPLGRNNDIIVKPHGHRLNVARQRLKPCRRDHLSNGVTLFEPPPGSGHRVTQLVIGLPWFGVVGWQVAIAAALEFGQCLDQIQRCLKVAGGLKCCVRIIDVVLWRLDGRIQSMAEVGQRQYRPPVRLSVGMRENDHFDPIQRGRLIGCGWSGQDQSEHQKAQADANHGAEFNPKITGVPRPDLKVSHGVAGLMNLREFRHGNQGVSQPGCCRVGSDRILSEDGNAGVLIAGRIRLGLPLFECRVSQEYSMMAMSCRITVFLLTTAAAGAALAAGMTLDDIARLQQVDEMAVSPDGRQVAWTRVVPRDLRQEDDGPAWQTLQVSDQTGATRDFVTGAVNVGSIQWVPDQSAIAFVSRRHDDEVARLYRIPVDGGEARPIQTPGEGSVIDYSFSADSAHVAVVIAQPEGEADRKRREKGFDAVVFEEQDRLQRLWIVSLAGGESRLVELDGSVQGVRWSPAGDRVLVRITPRQRVDDTLMFERMRIIDPSGDEIGRIDNPGKLGDAAWSPDGRWLAFVATESVHDTRAGRLMVAPADGGDWVHLLPDLAGHVIDVAWRDSDTITFVSHEGVRARVGTIRTDGSGESTQVSRPGLIVDRLGIGRNASLWLGASTPRHPRELYVADGEDTEPRRLTDSNPWLKEVELAKQEVVTYPARDGLSIEGLLVWPLKHDERLRYPLILAVHGGPESHYSNGWLTGYNLPAQHAAAEGYFMFFPNYRGSTGRGVEFALRSQGRPAREEFDDLVDGVDHLIERGLVDGERVGITGGSYGGYATAWGATYYSERFAAAVMNVGLSDKIAMLGTSDIPRELYLVHYRAWPWEDWALYREASPIFYVERAQTPLLILHGDADPRVDPTQSRILYRYLTLQDDPPPVRLVLYPGEGHGNQRAASRWDYSRRLMRWMNHYLKGEGGDPPPHAIPDLPLD